MLAHLPEGRVCTCYGLSAIQSSGGYHEEEVHECYLLTDDEATKHEVVETTPYIGHHKHLGTEAVLVPQLKEAALQGRQGGNFSTRGHHIPGFIGICTFSSLHTDDGVRLVNLTRTEELIQQQCHSCMVMNNRWHRNTGRHRRRRPGRFPSLGSRTCSPGVLHAGKSGREG